MGERDTSAEREREIREALAGLINDGCDLDSADHAIADLLAMLDEARASIKAIGDDRLSRHLADQARLDAATEQIDALEKRAEAAEAALAKAAEKLARRDADRAAIDRLRAEIDRLRAAQAAVVAAWDDDEIGRIDGALIDALRGAR